MKSFMEKLDIFKPELVLAVYALFTILGLIAFSLKIPDYKINPMTFILVFISFPLFFLGSRLAIKIHDKKVPKILTSFFVVFLIVFYSLVLSNFFSTTLKNSLFILIPALAIPYLALYHWKSRIKVPVKMPYFLIILGLFFFMLTLWQIGGIPILNPKLKLDLLKNIFWGISTLSFITGYFLLLPQIKKTSTLLLWIFLSTVLFALMAFRGALLIILLSGTLIAYYNKKLSNKTVLIPFVIAFILIISIGYITMSSVDPKYCGEECYKYATNPVSHILYRTSTTHIVFDTLVEKSIPFGLTHGTFFFHGDPRDYTGELMGYGGNLTYTMLGAPFVEFGYIGAFAWMFFLGLALKLAHLSMEKELFKGFYPLLFSLSLIWIETGMDPFQLLFLWMFLLFYMIKES